MLSSSISCTRVCGWVRCSVCFVQRMFWGHTLKERGIVATRTSWLGPCLSYWDAVPPLERVERLARVDWAPGFLNEMQFHHLNELNDSYELTGPLAFLMRCSFTTWTNSTTRASWVGPSCLNEMQRQVTLHFMSLKNTISQLEQIEPPVTIVLRLVRLVRVESPLSRLEKVVSIGHAWCF